MMVYYIKDLMMLPCRIHIPDGTDDIRQYVSDHLRSIGISFDCVIVN